MLKLIECDNFIHMKLTKQCPKCGSAEIYTNENMLLRGERSMVPLTGWTSFGVAVYLCNSCGYFEEYMSDKYRNLEKVQEKLKKEWRRV